MQNIKKILWKDVHDRVSELSPTVAKLIDAIPHQDHPSLYLAHYSFGELVVNEGSFQPPADSNPPPQSILDDLNYGPVPMLMSLNKTFELFLELGERTHPFHIFQPGKILGLWPILDKHPQANVYHQKIWSLASGVRTLFMLPKIMDSTAHSKLQRQLQLEEAYPPHSLFDQGLIFKAIAASPKMKCSWKNDTLIFGKGWADQLKAGMWPELHHFLLQQEWDDSLFLRNHLQLEAMWQVLAWAQAQTHLKPNAYSIDTVKHLLSIATNAALGFAPLTEKDDIYAPITAFQSAYLEHYSLKQYIPTLLAPAYIHERPAVYYSFLYPTLLSLSPNHNFRNTLEDQRNTKHILELFKNKLTQYPSYQNLLPQNIQFDFFHFEADAIHNILPVGELEKRDLLLSHFPQNKELIFSENGPFLRACVRISAT